MPETAPIVNVDRESMNALELRVAEIALHQIAEMINALTRKGAIYGQLILPQDQAARKAGM